MHFGLMRQVGISTLFHRSLTFHCTVLVVGCWCCARTLWNSLAIFQQKAVKQSSYFPAEECETVCIFCSSPLPFLPVCNPSRSISWVFPLYRACLLSLWVPLEDGWDTLRAEPETKWPPFCRQHFQMHFNGRKLLYFDSNFTELCS